MSETNKMTLSDIRTEVVRRNKHVEDLKERLEKLGKELQEILLDIDELEGVSPPRKRRARKPADAVAEPDAEPSEAPGAPPASAEPGLEAPRKRRGRPPRSEGAAGEPGEAEPRAAAAEAPARKGPSIVDVAVEVLRTEGKPLAPAELAQKVEERGGVSGNTAQVILMAAGRRSRIMKNEDGTIALIPGESAPPPA
ncbi:MAG: winged helix-turn-helix domain-containing protein [Planctomycetes bacterium]|nr:winged helix-turn-helix domain-containing protein [Planctomycetota bacterium]